MVAVGTRLLVHGGNVGTPFDTMSMNTIDDFWEYDTVAMRWRLLDAAAGVTGNEPGKLFMHDMVAVGTSVYLYGGADYNAWSAGKPYQLNMLR